MKKNLVITVVVLLMGSVVAHYHVAAQSYYPVVRVFAPGSFSYTAVLDPIHDRRGCGQATERFVKPVKDRCPQCEIVLARCARDLHTFDLATYSVVQMPGVRISIEASHDVAKRACELMANDVAKLGVRNAHCVASSPQANATTAARPI